MQQHGKQLLQCHARPAYQHTHASIQTPRHTKCQHSKALKGIPKHRNQTCCWYGLAEPAHTQYIVLSATAGLAPLRNAPAKTRRCYIFHTRLSGKPQLRATLLCSLCNWPGSTRRSQQQHSGQCTVHAHHRDMPTTGLPAARPAPRFVRVAGPATQKAGCQLHAAPCMHSSLRGTTSHTAAASQADVSIKSHQLQLHGLQV